MRKVFVFCFFLLIASLPAVAGIRTGSMVVSHEKNNCERFLIEKDVDRDVQILVLRYLFSEPLSEHILKSLILGDYNVRGLAVFDHSDSVRIEIAKKIFSYMQDWVLAVHNKKIMKQAKLAEKMDIQDPEFFRINRLFKDDDEVERLRDAFVKVLSPQLRLYFRFLNETKFLWKPNITLRKSVLHRPIYVFWSSIAALGGVSLADGYHLMGGTTGYLLMAASGALVSFPWITAPAFTYAYDKTVGRFYRKKFLRKNFPGGQPLALADASKEIAQYDKYPIPSPPPRLPSTLEKPKEPQRSLKDVLLDMENLLRVVQDEQEKIDTNMSLSSTLKFGQGFRALEKLLVETKEIFFKMDKQEQVNWIDELQEIALLKNAWTEALEAFWLKGYEIFSQIKQDQEKRQASTLGERLTQLNELKSALFAQMEDLQLSLDKTLMEHLEQ